MQQALSVNITERSSPLTFPSAAAQQVQQLRQIAASRDDLN
jgi:hypothetical protein